VRANAQQQTCQQEAGKEGPSELAW